MENDALEPELKLMKETEVLLALKYKNKQLCTTSTYHERQEK
jgi:hypothetical protein